MSINVNNDKNIPIDPDACYEELASQEECTSKRQRKK
jgi:hypothetical protein